MTSVFGHRRAGTRGRSGIFGGPKLDLNTPEGLEAFARSKGLEPPKENKVLNALLAVSRVFALGNAASAGAAKGALDPELSVSQGIAEGLRRNLSFSDVIREDIGIDPESRAGKIGVGVVGFTADVAFDPLTYLTFGMGAGLKVGGKALTKGGVRLTRKATKEVIASQQKALARGMSASIAQEVAQRKATGIVNDLMIRATGKKGLTQEGIDKFIQRGIDRGTVDKISLLGPHLLDKGGIKFFGKTLISSKVLARTPVGRAAKRLGQTEIAQALKNSLGKLFVFDFGRNPAIAKILNKANLANRRAIRGLIEANRKLFAGLGDNQLTTFFDQVFKKKLEILPTGEEILAKAQTFNQKQLAELGIKTAFKAGRPTKKLAEAARKAVRREKKAIQQTEKLAFEDPKLQALSDQLFEGDNAIVKKFASLAGLNEEDFIKFYIPSKFRDRLLVRDFAIGRNLSSPSMGFLKEFRGVVTDKLIRDPFEAFTRGQVEVVTARIKTAATRKTISNLGKPIKALTEQRARELGYVKWTRNTLEGRMEGWMPKEIADELNRFWTKGPNAVEDFAKASGFDYATGIFKGYVTSIFPAFHVRNITSNQFQNFVKFGVNVADPRLQKAATDIIFNRKLNDVLTTKAGKRITKRQIKELVKRKTDIFETGAFGRMEQLLEQAGTKVARPTTLLKRLNPLSRENVALQFGRNIGQKFEARDKMVGIVSELLEGKNIDDAIKASEDALFNYSQLTEFERTVMRRVIPFYTWSRKNFELQMKALTRTPGRVATQLKLIRGIGDAFGEPVDQEDLEGLPFWVLDSVGIKAGMNQYGQNMYLTGFGLPIEEFLDRFSGEGSIISNVIMNTLTRTNPNLKLPVELALNFDFFRKRPITEITNGETLKPFLDSVPGAAGRELKELLGWREIPNQPVYANGRIVARTTKYTANPIALAFLRNMFTSRLQSTVGFLTDEDQTPLARFFRGFTGIKQTSIDQERQKYFDDLDRKDELKKWLFRMGVLSEREILFEKKQ